MKRPFPTWASSAIAAVLALGALFGTAARHEWTAGAAALQESDMALARGDAKGAIVHARDAAEAAVPFSPSPKGAYDRLESIARDEERKGDLDLASFAWRAMRSAAVATKPAAAGEGRVAEADEAILRIARSSASSANHAADETVIRDELATDETPPLWVTFGLTLGAVAVAFFVTKLARARPAPRPVGG